MEIAGLVDEAYCNLLTLGDPERGAGARAYLKIDLEFIGVAAKPLREVARSFLGRHPDLDRAHLLKLMRPLWFGSGQCST